MLADPVVALQVAYPEQAFRLDPIPSAAIVRSIADPPTLRPIATRKSRRASLLLSLAIFSVISPECLVSDRTPPY